MSPHRKCIWWTTADIHKTRAIRKNAARHAAQNGAHGRVHNVQDVLVSLKVKNFTSFTLISEHDESCTGARAAHDTLYEHDHKMQFHGDKWPKTDTMQFPSKYSV